MRYENRKYTTPYKNAPTLVLKKKIERIDELCEKLTENHLNEDDISHIKAILRETQYCIENLYVERKQNK